MRAAVGIAPEKLRGSLLLALLHLTQRQPAPREVVNYRCSTVIPIHNLAREYRCKKRIGSEYIGYRVYSCLLYTSPSPRDGLLSRMPSSA